MRDGKREQWRRRGGFYVYGGAGTMGHMEHDTPTIVVDDEDEDDDLDEAEPVPQVSSYIAIIRIVAVLGMGLCASFGLFIMLVGVKGVLVGIPIMLLSIPCYYGMQLAERLAAREERKTASS
jgi:hypothetical protein